ncbi:hypothetical protein [Bacillus testis]|uniref:hypothetical protein n=1 Tax=Bacillus testis TaxID=1622072 RepID=UPI000ACAB815|nr:hypothetical protein [Bacillus testis]
MKKSKLAIYLPVGLLGILIVAGGSAWFVVERGKESGYKASYSNKQVEANEVYGSK